MEGLYTQVKGSKAPLLMIHGIISDSSFFSGCMPYLERHYKVITYDRRGYGQSVEQEYHDFRVKAQALDAAEILQKVCDKPAWVMGNSAGGLIALELAIEYPKLVNGLVLLEPSLGYDEKEREKLHAWNQELNGYVKSGKIKQALPAFSRVAGGKGGRSGGLSELKRTYRNLENFLHGELNEVQNYLPSEECLKALKCPVVIGVTQEGREGLFGTSSQTAAKYLGWPLEIFPGYHNVAQEQPEQFAEKLIGVLAKLRQ